MFRNRGWLFVVGGLAVALSAVGVGWSEEARSKAAEGSQYKNLKVLPPETTREEMGRIMLDNLRGLGLPRRAGEGCLFCHAGSLDTPRRDWDYASDEKPTKRKARVMMAMTQAINDDFLAKLPSRLEPSVAVTCDTCHAGRTNPTPLPDRLLAAHADGGLDALKQFYTEARDDYYESDTYDFRVRTLSTVADHLALGGAVEDAAAVHQLNIDHEQPGVSDSRTDELSARGGLIRLRMNHALSESGVDAMLETYNALKADHPAEAFSPAQIGGLAWALFRKDSEQNKQAGMRLFEVNYADFPEDYFATENLAWGLESVGEHEEAVKLAEAWLKKHPGHKLAQVLLAELNGSQR